METKEPEQPIDGMPEYSSDGVDVSLIRWFQSLTPGERIRFHDEQVRSIERLRNARGKDEPARPS